MSRVLTNGCVRRLFHIGLLGGGFILLAPRPLSAQGVNPSGNAPADTLGEARRLVGEKRFEAAISLLEAYQAGHPQNGQALMALGSAHRELGHLDQAARVFQQAAELPRAGIPARRALFGMYAGAGRPADAFHWFEALKGKIDLTALAEMQEAKSLHDDPRFAVLFPDHIAFDHPFAEHGTRIIHEWRGESAGDEFGWIARAVGDVDRDGVTDVVISATANPPYGSARGTIYVYSGKSGKLLWKRMGDQNAVLGTGLESAGDDDGDGVPDVVAGAPGINSVLVLSGRDGHELLRLRGDSIDADLGAAVAGVGDVDGDGRADIVAGAPSSGARGAGAGRAYVFSGRDGRRLVTLDGEKAGDAFGSTVGGGGGSVIIGAAGAGPESRGRVYLFHGANPQPIYVKDADQTGVALGNMFVSVLGDIDGDGEADIYASDFANSAKGPSTGRIYVYSGRTGETLLTITGDTAGEGFGIGAGRTGDLDGDGRADLVIGSWQYSGAAWSGGRVQVLSGRDGHVLQTVTGRVPGETLGFDAVGVGDIDGDGITDFLITSAWSMVNGIRSGRVYIVAGTTAGRKKR